MGLFSNKKVITENPTRADVINRLFSGEVNNTVKEYALKALDETFDFKVTKMTETDEIITFENDELALTITKG